MQYWVALDMDLGNTMGFATDWQMGRQNTLENLPGVSSLTPRAVLVTQ